MKLGLHANRCDSSTWRVADALLDSFKELADDLSGDYGGTMEHLWIDVELVESDAELRPPWTFRFQKKVGGSTPCSLTGLPRPVYMNVGHYSVRPDFEKLRSVPQEAVVTHVLGLIYASTSVLLEKQKKLGGFDAQRFRENFLIVCEIHGFKIETQDGPPLRQDDL
jgi:hypothetical protein